MQLAQRSSTARHGTAQHITARHSAALTLRNGLQLSVVRMMCVAVWVVRQVHGFVARLLLRRRWCLLLPLLHLLLPLLRLLCRLLRLLLCCRLRSVLRLRLVRPKVRQQHTKGAERVAQAADEAAAGQIL